MTGTGERYGEQPSDMAESREAGCPPRKNLIRDSSETVELRDGLDLPVVSGYGARPVLAEKLRRFVLWLEEQFEER
jgi:hypothetical protein